MITKEERAELIEYFDDEAVTAFIELVGEEYATKDQFEEAYQGQYSSDEEFAQETAEACGEIPSAGSSAWPLYCIDWEYAARELMHDYSESGGYYFRNL